MVEVEEPRWTQQSLVQAEVVDVRKEDRTGGCQRQRA